MSQQLALFKYDSLDVETRIVVQQRTTEIKNLERQITEKAWEMGQKLIDVRERLQHGEFLGWLILEFPEWSQRTAYNLISIAENLEFAKFANLGIGRSALIALASPSTPETARQEALGRAEQGETIAYSTAKQIVNQHKIERQYREDEESNPADYMVEWGIESLNHEIPKPSLSLIDTSTGEILNSKPIEDNEELDNTSKRFDPSNQVAYCKYCYTTHERWVTSPDHGPGVYWYCSNCDHVSSDEFIQIYELQPVVEKEEIKPVQQSQSMALLASSKNDSWRTPLRYIEAARLVMGGIDLDAATSEQANESIQALSWFTKDDDALNHKWHGRVWLNPPYGKTDGKSNQGLFAAKLTEEYEAGRVTQGILLVNLYWSYEWFSPLRKRPICLPDNRITFINPETNEEGDEAKASSVFVYFGKDPLKFYEVFSQFGYCGQLAKF